jgi:hypothetical protein
MTISDRSRGETFYFLKLLFFFVLAIQMKMMQESVEDWSSKNPHSYQYNKSAVYNRKYSIQQLLIFCP